MGIFKDIATSPLGDVTLGAFEALDNIAVRDARNNATIANDSLNKENEAFKKTELAFKNKGQIVNILKQNPEAFGISAGDLTTDQIAERLAGFMFNNERTIFENNDFNKVKLGVANFLARNPGEGFELTDPYVASADMFNKEKQLHAAKLSEISKMPKADKLLFNIEEAQAEVPDPEIITDKLTKVAALSAKGYGILRSFPTSEEGITNLKFMQTNIIVANARALFPNDNAKRMDFINKKLYDNNIDPLESIKFQSPVTFRSMVTILDAKARGAASQITELNNQFAQAETDERRKQITQQLDNLILGQYKTINEFSADAPQVLAGKDRSLVYREGQPDMQFAVPEAAEGYVPSVDSKGQVIVERADGINQKLDLELLINEPDNLKALPQITQNYVNQIKDNLFKDGDMIKPTREMFEDGPEGDKAFRDFLGIYNTLGQEDLLTDQLPPRTSIIDPAEEKEKIRQEFEAEKAKTKQADISKFKVTDPNKIEVEELPPANQENKQDTDQEPDVFEESGVEPKFQSASLKDKFGAGLKYKQKDVNAIFQNNNPGNVKVSSDWKGETYTGAKGETYKKFKSKAAGLADILSTISKYDLNSLDDIMSIYATDDASGKVVRDYSGILQRDHNVPASLNFKNKKHLMSLLKGIVHVENSVIPYKGRKYVKAYEQYYLDKDYSKAIELFLGGKEV
jgi:hypothetical protein